MRFRCLNCCADLKQEKHRLVCPKCGRSWRIDDGIPQFCEESFYWGEITKKEMDYVNRQSEDWKDALQKVTKKQRNQFPEPYSFITDLSRANWYLLLPLNRESCVLDIGAGMGTVSEVLARRYSEIVAIEPVMERLLFCKKRFQQGGIRNVKLVQANALELPFPENSFDLVVMNGVLEWVAMYGKGDPERIQEQVLGSVHRILKPNGYLYLGIENRLSYKHFLGRYDPHVDLIFISLMPRFLANIYSRIFTGKPYRTYIYSSKGYEKLLRRAGFKGVEIYNVLPDYNLPTYMIPLRSKSYEYLLDLHRSFANSFQRLGFSIAKLLAKAGLLNQLLPAFIIFGKK